MAKKESSSKKTIGGMLKAAWNAVKGKPRSERGTKAEVEQKAIKKIADKLNRSPKQIKDIYEGKRPGKNLEKPLRDIKNKRKPAPPPKKEAKRKEREKPPKPPEGIPPTRPGKIGVTLRGNIGPYYDSDYLRGRSIAIDLSGDELEAFLSALEEGNKAKAAQIAVGAYFEPTGNPGYVDTLNIKQLTFREIR